MRPIDPTARAPRAARAVIAGLAACAAYALVGMPVRAADDALLDEAQRIGSELRCPVCQGMPIAESPSPMAQDMMKAVRDLLAQGQSRDAIVTYFVERYGDWVLLQPRAEGVHLMLWIVPALCALGGVVLVGRTYAKAAKNPTDSGRTPIEPIPFADTADRP